MKKKRVLVVEDDSSVAVLLREGLSDLDVELETAKSGNEALRRMDLGAWDVVITDYRMPGISGIELIERVKDRTPTTRTVLITAFGSEEVKEEAQRLNVYRYMIKPFPLAEIRRVVQEALTVKEDVSGLLTGGNGSRGLRKTLKVTLGGDGNVGKTSMIHRLCTGTFDTTRSVTIGVEFHIYDIQLGESSTRLVVWDVSGQDHFAFTRRAFYRGSKAVGLVYSVDDRRSFERLPAWRDEIREHLPTVPLVIVGNKTDLPRRVSWNEGSDLADRWAVPFFESDCVSGRGVAEFFGALASSALKQRV